MKCLPLFLLLTIGLEGSAQNEVKITDFEGLEPYLEKSNDTTYLVNFWATWCKPCVEEMPAFMEINDKFSDRSFKMLLVSLDFPGQIESRLLPYIRENNIGAEVIVLDDPNSNQWIPMVDSSWSGSIPATYFYNRHRSEFHEKKLDYNELNDILTKFITK